MTFSTRLLTFFVTITGLRKSGLRPMCLPNGWSAPTISGDGTAAWRWGWRSFWRFDHGFTHGLILMFPSLVTFPHFWCGKPGGLSHPRGSSHYGVYKVYYIPLFWDDWYGFRLWPPVMVGEWDGLWHWVYHLKNLGFDSLTMHVFWKPIQMTYRIDKT